MTTDGEAYFLELDRLARPLRIDAYDVAVAALERMENIGCSRMEAVHMTLRDALQRKGRYHGILKTLVDTGMVFQLRENNATSDGGNKLRADKSFKIGSLNPVDYKTGHFKRAGRSTPAGSSPARRNAATGRESGEFETL